MLKKNESTYLTHARMPNNPQLHYCKVRLLIEYHWPLKDQWNTYKTWLKLTRSVESYLRGVPNPLALLFSAVIHEWSMVAVGRNPKGFGYLTTTLTTHIYYARACLVHW